MVKINFQNNITKCNADTFNTLQDNIEDAIQEENILLTNYVDNKLTYSTDEKVVGTWIDGKPLYRKVYIFPTLANAGNVSVNIDSTFKVQRYDIYVENPNNYKFKLPVMGTNYIASFMDYTSNKLTIQTTSDRTAFTQNYAIVEYTKTTD